MSTIDTIRVGTRSGAPFSGFEGRFRRLLTTAMQRLAVMVEKQRSRRLLLRLSDDQLKDIGLTRADAYGEAYRPFWD